MIYDIIPRRPFVTLLAADVRAWLLDHVEPHTGPLFDPLPTADLELFGATMAAHFKLNEPRAAIVHRDLQVPEHVDTPLLPYPAMNLAIFWRSHGVKGGALFFPGQIVGTADLRPLECPATNGTVAVFDGTQPHGIRPFTVPPGGYRMTVTFYCPR